MSVPRVSVHVSAQIGVHLPVHVPVFDSAALWCSVEVLLADGRVVAGAAKQVPFEGLLAAKAHAELEGLLAMQGKPLLVQGLAACVHTATDHHYLPLIME